MDFSHHTVLIIDDEEANRQFIFTVLERELKVRVIETENPKEAFEYMKTNIPSLILLDMQMPVMDGYTALRHIRTIPATKDIPVIACTALNSENLLFALAQLKISDYILKPIRRNVLLEKVKKVLMSIDNIDINSIPSSIF